MSVLDTFYLLFESNANKVKDETEKATAAGVKLEETLNATDRVATEGAQAITVSNTEAVASIEAMIEAQEMMAVATHETSTALEDMVAAQEALAHASGPQNISTAIPAKPKPLQLFDTNEALVGMQEVQEAMAHVETTAHTLAATEHELGEAGAEAGKHIEHELDEVEEKLNFVGRGVEELKEKFHEFGEGIIESSLEIAAAFAALFALEKVVDDVFEQAEKSDQLGETARSLGVNIEQLDAWGNAVKRVGGTAEGFQGSLANVNRQLARIAVTGKSRSLKIFESLGIDAKKAKSAFDLLPQLADKIQGMDKAKSGGMLRSIGLDEGTIRLIQAGNHEIDELLERQKMLGNITAEDAETAEKFNREWDDTKQLFRGIAIDLDDTFLPLLGDLLEVLIDVIAFLRDHKDAVIGFFIGASVAAFVLADALGLVDVLFAILTSPITATIAAITGLIAVFALLYDDIANFLEGNNSLIGEMAKRWPIVGQAVREFANIVIWMKDQVIEAFHDIMGWIEKLPEGFAIWGEKLKRASDLFAGFSLDIKGHIAELPEWMQATFSAIGTMIGDVFKGAGVTSVEALRAIGTGGVAVFQELGAIIRLIAQAFTDPVNAVEHFGEANARIVGEIIKNMPELTEAFAAVGKAFDVIGNAILAMWAAIKAAVADTVGFVESAAHGIASAASAVGGFIAHPFGGNNMPPPGVAAGQARLGEAQAGATLLSQSSDSLAAGKGKTEIHVSAPVSIGTVTTQATDGQSLAAELPGHLEDHYTTTLHSLFGTGATD